MLNDETIAFLAALQRKFNPTRLRLLRRREARQQEFDAGALPDFLPETKEIRESDWVVAPIPPDLLDRRVEITGPVDRKMIVNALNSGAKVFMADFEDANSPTWANVVEGQINLKDRWQGQIDFKDPQSGKDYKLGPKPAVLLVRPRGWHLPEEHLVVDSQPMSGSLFDFRPLLLPQRPSAALAAGSGPYFYLPKLESHLEARLWNEVFTYAEQALGIPHGSIKATVLIETLPAAFEMDEIIYELRDHMAGLNCGRWDYIFSFIKTLRNKPEFLLPDRGQVVMGKAFLHAYSELLIKTCHRRGAFAMGGMAAQIPDRRNPAVNVAAFEKVRADKEREAKAGHDGTWVAHPDLVPVAMEVFDKYMPSPNQLDRKREEVTAGQKDLLQIHEGTRTRGGAPPEHPGRRPVHRGVAPRPRRGAALQPHGGRGDRRDQPLADLAGAAFRRDPRRRSDGDARAVRPAARRGDGAGQGRDRPGQLRRRPLPRGDRDFPLAVDRRHAVAVPDAARVPDDRVRLRTGSRKSRAPWQRPPNHFDVVADRIRTRMR